jgi:hypothetical protein
VENASRNPQSHFHQDGIQCPFDLRLAAHGITLPFGVTLTSMSGIVTRTMHEAE